MEEFKKDYMELVKESLTTENRTQLIKKCEEFTNEVIKKGFTARRYCRNS